MRQKRILRIGTAGWSVASRYAAQVPLGGTHLQRYARVLNAVEINSSFHRAHQRKTYERWAASVPDDFRFAVKVPKTITHEKKLAGCADEIAQFVDEVAGLGPKLSVLLVQLPPSLPLDRAMAGRFFTTLGQAINTRVALEPRHASWFSPAVDRWLASRKIARVAADPAKIEGAAEPGGWPALRYFRWHGSPRMYYSGYDAHALAALQKRLDHFRNAGEEVWCMFDNTTLSAALGNALTLVNTA